MDTIKLTILYLQERRFFCQGVFWPGRWFLRGFSPFPWAGAIRTCIRCHLASRNADPEPWLSDILGLTKSMEFSDMITWNPDEKD